MRLTGFNNLIVCALGMALAGCSSVSGAHLFSQTSGGPTEALSKADTNQTGNSLTQAGRFALDAGQPSEAIARFQKALAAGEPIAPAFNGIGVSYARLGKQGLAQWFFEQAIAADPTNRQYQANLTQSGGALVLAAHQDCGIGPQPMESDTLASATAARGPAPKAAPPAGQLQRVSRSEVRVISAPAFPAPVAKRPSTVSKAQVAGLEAELNGFKPAVRIALNEAKPAPAKGWKAK